MQQLNASCSAGRLSSKPYMYHFRMTIYLPHHSNLFCSFIQVTLIDTHRVHPYETVKPILPKLLKRIMKIARDVEIMVITCNSHRIMSATPNIGQRIVFGRTAFVVQLGVTQADNDFI